MMQVAVISPLTATLDGLFAYQVISPKAASLEVKDVLECTAEEAQKHLKTFFEVMDTSPPHVTYKIGIQQLPACVWVGVWRGVWARGPGGFWSVMKEGCTSCHLL